MKSLPNVANVAALIADPARAAILDALLDGRAWTATELSIEAGVTPQTTSSHLAKLLDGGMVAVAKQGRHRYYRIDNPQVAHILETLAVAPRGSAIRAPATTIWPGGSPWCWSARWSTAAILCPTARTSP